MIVVGAVREPPFNKARGLGGSRTAPTGMRIKIILSYRGTHFSGWQIQPGARTVQGVLEQKLQKIIGERVPVMASGRTDSGVHAWAQVCHFDIPQTFEHFLKKPPTKTHPFCRLHHSLNSMLPSDMVILELSQVKESFHALKGAKRKRYVYAIQTGSLRPAIIDAFAWHIGDPLDVKAMRQASRFMIGRHDFKSFCGANSTTKTSIRHVTKIVIKKGSMKWPGMDAAELKSFLTISIESGGFLKNMVRNMVGTLVAVGRHKTIPQDVKRILKARDRREAGMTAPPQGLFLAKVFY